MGNEPPRAMVVGYSLNPPEGSPNLIFYQSNKPLLGLTQTGTNAILRPFGIGRTRELLCSGSVDSEIFKHIIKIKINFE